MRIEKIELYKFDLSLKNAISINGNCLESRQGLIIKITDKDELVGIGEISPLPFYSDETLEDATIDAKYLIPFLLKQEIDSPESLANLNMNDQYNKISGSLKFGIESACYSLLARNQGKSLREFITPNCTSKFKINGLLSGSTEQIIKKAKQLQTANYKSVKLKVRNLDIDSAVNLTKQVAGLLGDDVSLRIDANQNFSLENSVKYYNEVSSCNIEYLEEPLSLQIDYLKLSEHNIPIAFDESLRSISQNEINSYENTRALVIKPMILGFIKSLELIKFAKQNNLKPVISSCYETSIGASNLVELALSVNMPDLPMGLDTMDLYSDSLSNSNDDLDYSLLERIDL